MPDANRKWLKVTVLALSAIAIAGLIAWILLGLEGDNQGNHASACRKLDALCEGPGSCCDGLYCDVKSEDRKCKTCINNQSENCLGNDYACCGGTVCGPDDKCGDCIGTTDTPCGPHTKRCCTGTWCSSQTKTCRSCIDKDGVCAGEKSGSCCDGLMCSTDGTCQECIQKDAQGCHVDGDCCTGLACVKENAGETGTCKNCTTGQTEPCSATKPCCGSNNCNPDGSCAPCNTGACNTNADCCDSYVCAPNSQSSTDPNAKKGQCKVCLREGDACGGSNSLFCCPNNLCKNSKCVTFAGRQDFKVALLTSGSSFLSTTGLMKGAPIFDSTKAPATGTTYWYLENGKLGAETVTTDAGGTLKAARQWVACPTTEDDTLTMMDPGQVPALNSGARMIVTNAGNILYQFPGDTKIMSLGSDTDTGPLKWSSQRTPIDFTVSLPPSGAAPGAPCSDSAPCAAPYGSCHNGTCTYCYQSLKTDREKVCYTGQSLACDARDDGSGYDWQCASSSLVCDPGKYGDACPVPGQTKICGANGEWGPCESVAERQLKCKSATCDHGSCPDGCAPALTGADNPRAVWKDGSYWQTTCGADGRWECKSYCCDPSRDLTKDSKCAPPEGEVSCKTGESQYCTMNKNGVMKWGCAKKSTGGGDICDDVPDPPGCLTPIHFVSGGVCHKRCRGSMTREDWIVKGDLQVQSLTGDDGKTYEVVFGSEHVLPIAPSTACDRDGVNMADADEYKLAMLGNPRGNVEPGGKFRVCKPTTDGQSCIGRCGPDGDASANSCWYKTVNNEVCPWMNEPPCQPGLLCCYNGGTPDVSVGSVKCKCTAGYLDKTCTNIKIDPSPDDRYVLAIQTDSDFFYIKPPVSSGAPYTLKRAQVTADGTAPAGLSDDVAVFYFKLGDDSSYYTIQSGSSTGNYLKSTGGYGTPLVDGPGSSGDPNCRWKLSGHPHDWYPYDYNVVTNEGNGQQLNAWGGQIDGVSIRFNGPLSPAPVNQRWTFIPYSYLKQNYFDWWFHVFNGE